QVAPASLRPRSRGRWPGHNATFAQRLADALHNTAVLTGLEGKFSEKVPDAIVPRIPAPPLLRQMMKRSTWRSRNRCPLTRGDRGFASPSLQAHAMNGSALS